MLRGLRGKERRSNEEHCFSLAYTVTLFTLYDGAKVYGGQLQREALRCAEKIGRERERKNNVEHCFSRAYTVSLFALYYGVNILVAQL